MTGQLEYRSAEVTGVSFPQRTIELVVMPYEVETVADYHGRAITEICSRGAFDGIETRSRRVKLNRDHDAGRTCGKATTFHPNRPEGLVAEVKIARTPLGDETLTLADEGILDASAGFRPLMRDDGRLAEEWPRRDYRRLQKVWLGHIAMVPDPAYEGANVLSVRSDPVTAERLTEAPAALERPNLDRARALRLEDLYASISH